MTQAQCGYVSAFARPGYGIVLVCLLLVIACGRMESTVFVQGDGSTAGCRILLDGKEVGRMTSSRGSLPDLPPSAVVSRMGHEPVRDGWLHPAPGYATCYFRTSPGFHGLTMTTEDGRELRATLRVDAGAEVRASFALMAVQCFSDSP